MLEASKLFPNEIEVHAHIKLTDNQTRNPYAVSESNEYVIDFFADDEYVAEEFIQDEVLNFIVIQSKKGTLESTKVTQDGIGISQRSKW